MQYPNRRYGSPTAMEHYAIWYGSEANLAKALKRSRRTVRDWITGRAKVPWWVPEIMRLQQMEHNAMVYRMTGREVAARLGVATGGEVIDAGARFRPDPLDVAPSGGQVRNLVCHVAQVPLQRIDPPGGHIGQHVQLADTPINAIDEPQRRHDKQVQRR